MIPADWKRIESTDEVPKSFYMSTPFDTAKNKVHHTYELILSTSFQLIYFPPPTW